MQKNVSKGVLLPLDSLSIKVWAFSTNLENQLCPPMPKLMAATFHSFLTISNAFQPLRWLENF